MIQIIYLSKQFCRLYDETMQPTDADHPSNGFHLEQRRLARSRRLNKSFLDAHNAYMTD